MIMMRIEIMSVITNVVIVGERVLVVVMIVMVM